MAEFTSIKASITLVNIKDGEPGTPAKLLDWVKDWDSNKVKIGESEILSPKMFAGTVTGEGKNQTITGLAFGRDVLGTGESAGLVAYHRNNPTIKFNTDGSAVFGSIPGKQFIINADGSILTPKVTITDVDSNFATDLDLGNNVSNSGVTMFFNYDSAIVVPKNNTTPINIFYQGISLRSNSNLSIHILIKGTASEDCEITLNLLMDNIHFGYSPMKQKIAKGPFVIGLPINAFHMNAGIRYLQVSMTTTEGTITIPVNGAQLAIEGKMLVGASSAAAPHAEALDVIVWKGFDDVMKSEYRDFITKTKVTFCENSAIDPIVSDHIGYKSKNFSLKNDSLKENVILEIIERGFLEDMLRPYKRNYTFNENVFIFDDINNMCFLNQREDAEFEKIDEIGIYEAVAVDRLKWENTKGEIIY